MSRSNDLAVIACLAIICSMTTGCVIHGGNYSHLTRSITSPIRSTAMKQRGEVEATVTIQDVQTSNAIPTEDDAALLIPELEFGVNGRAGLGSGIYVVFSGGPDIGITRSFGESYFSWGAFGALTATAGSKFFTESDGSVVDIGSLMGFYRVGLAVHWTPRDVLSWEVGVALQNYAIADFNGGLSLDRHGVVPYAGMRVTADVGVYGYAQLHFPIGFEYTNASPMAGILGLGWAFGPNLGGH